MNKLCKIPSVDSWTESCMMLRLPYMPRADWQRRMSDLVRSFLSLIFNAWLINLQESKALALTLWYDATNLHWSTRQRGRPHHQLSPDDIPGSEARLLFNTLALWVRAPSSNLPALQSTCRCVSNLRSTAQATQSLRSPSSSSSSAIQAKTIKSMFI